MILGGLRYKILHDLDNITANSLDLYTMATKPVQFISSVEYNIGDRLAALVEPLSALLAESYWLGDEWMILWQR